MELIEDHPYITSAYLWTFSNPPNHHPLRQHKYIKVQLFWEGHKNLKNLPLVLTLLSKNSCLVKTGGRYFPILWPSHNVLTLLNVSKNFTHPPRHFVDALMGWSLEYLSRTCSFIYIECRQRALLHINRHSRIRSSSKKSPVIE